MVGGSGGFGEDCGRFLFSQLLDAIEHMHERNIAHRDLKLENILVSTTDMSLKVADFGYAAQGTDQLRSYRGTFTYMAPEIKEGRVYNGKKADLFSAAVVLFILVRGIFPFKEARKEEFFYSLLQQRKFAEYWTKVESTYLSEECRDLLQKLFSYDPSERPSIEEIRQHPWMQ
jgi:serine/threonine-protein kinase SRK2